MNQAASVSGGGALGAGLIAFLIVTVIGGWVVLDGGATHKGKAFGAVLIVAAVLGMMVAGGLLYLSLQ